MLIETKTKIRFYILGVVHNVNINIMKLCPSIIVIVVNLNNHNTKEIFNLIHVDKFAVEKEDPIALILVRSFVIKANANLASMKGHKLFVNVEKVRE